MLFPILFGLIITAVFYFSQGRPDWGLWIAYVGFCIGGLAVTMYIFNWIFSETETYGVLWPADDPLPPKTCPENIPAGDLIAFLGNNTYYTNKFPHVAIKIKDENFLFIDKYRYGISITLKIFDRNRKIIAEIKNNKFYLNPNNIFKRERPDKHTLIVYDQKGEKVLYVRHLNQSAIKILGTFHFPNTPSLFITEDVLKIGVASFSHVCFGRTGGVTFN